VWPAGWLHALIRSNAGHHHGPSPGGCCTLERADAFGVDAQVWQAILSQRIDMGAPELRIVSPAAKDLLTGLLERDPDSRLTPKQALDHPWIRVRSSLLALPMLVSPGHTQTCCWSVEKRASVDCAQPLGTTLLWHMMDYPQAGGTVQRGAGVEIG